jgi:hypothetical protein
LSLCEYNWNRAERLFCCDVDWRKFGLANLAFCIKIKLWLELAIIELRLRAADHFWNFGFWVYLWLTSDCLWPMLWTAQPAKGRWVTEQLEPTIVFVQRVFCARQFPSAILICWIQDSPGYKTLIFLQFAIFFFGMQAQSHIYVHVKSHVDVVL